MEENKAKNVNMSKQKLTYEQLEEVSNQLAQQNKQLRMQVYDLQTRVMLERLTFLFKVVESTYPFPKDFRDKCANEITDLMTIKEDKDEQTK